MKQPLLTALNDSGTEPAAGTPSIRLPPSLDAALTTYATWSPKAAASLKVGAQTWGTVRHEDLDAFLTLING